MWSIQDDEWEEIDDDEDEDDDDEDVEDGDEAGAMETKSSNKQSSVFKELSDFKHLVTEEVQVLYFMSHMYIYFFSSVCCTIWFLKLVLNWREAWKNLH